jgi:nicotinamidase-related amidase
MFQGGNAGPEPINPEAARLPQGYEFGMRALERESSLLLVVDVQLRLVEAMPSSAASMLVKNTLILLETARLLGISVLATEQYPKGLGATVSPLGETLASLGVKPIEKMTFDACGEPAMDEELAKLAPRSVVLVGIEAHVCVFQTARELANRGIDVRVASDAVASRNPAHCERGLALSERAGAAVMPTESIVFDWLRRAGSDEFKAISKLVR